MEMRCQRSRQRPEKYSLWTPPASKTFSRENGLGRLANALKKGRPVSQAARFFGDTRRHHARRQLDCINERDRVRSRFPAQTVIGSSSISSATKPSGLFLPNALPAFAPIQAKRLASSRVEDAMSQARQGAAV